MKSIFSILLSVCLAASPTPCASQTVGIWNIRTPPPAKMAEVGVATLDGRIYVVGGTEQVAHEPPMWASTLAMSYDPVTDSWRRLAPLPLGLSHVGVAALGHTLYAVGGFTGIIHLDAQSSLFEYDPRKDSWRRLRDMPAALGSVSAVAIDGKLNIFGGRHPDRIVRISAPGKPEISAGFGTVTSHFIYDPATDRWSEGSPIPGPPRDHAGAVALRGKVHLFGGRVADVGDNLDRHDVYDPRKDRWSTAAPLPQRRSAGAYTVLRGRIVYAGGECKPGGAPFTPNAYDDVTVYDVRTDSWSTISSLPSARHGFGAASLGGVAYFVGGAPVCGGGAIAELLSLTIR